MWLAALFSWCCLLSNRCNYTEMKLHTVWFIHWAVWFIEWLSPLMYICYTKNCWRYYNDRHLLMFAEDTVCSRMEKLIMGLPWMTVEWCDDHSLKLNVQKTKYGAIDFKEISAQPPQLLLKGFVLRQWRAKHTWAMWKKLNHKLYMCSLQKGPAKALLSVQTCPL